MQFKINCRERSELQLLQVIALRQVSKSTWLTSWPAGIRPQWCSKTTPCPAPAPAHEPQIPGQLWEDQTSSSPGEEMRRVWLQHPWRAGEQGCAMTLTPDSAWSPLRTSQEGQPSSMGTKPGTPLFLNTHPSSPHWREPLCKEWAQWSWSATFILGTNEAVKSY